MNVCMLNIAVFLTTNESRIKQIIHRSVVLRSLIGEQSGKRLNRANECPILVAIKNHYISLIVQMKLSLVTHVVMENGTTYL